MLATAVAGVVALADVVLLVAIGVWRSGRSLEVQHVDPGVSPLAESLMPSAADRHGGGLGLLVAALLLDGG